MIRIDRQRPPGALPSSKPARRPATVWRDRGVLACWPGCVLPVVAALVGLGPGG